MGGAILLLYPDRVSHSKSKSKKRYTLKELREIAKMMKEEELISIPFELYIALDQATKSKIISDSWQQNGYAVIDLGGSFSMTVG